MRDDMSERSVFDAMRDAELKPRECCALLMAIEQSMNHVCAARTENSGAALR